MTTYTIIAGVDDSHNALYKDGVRIFSASEDYLNTETLFHCLPKIDPDASIRYLQMESNACENMFNTLHDYPEDFDELMAYELIELGV